ncbi:hypothetical protein [Neobacillus niacini]|uniref:hypothetical protein n=1 Tax=Neobacillus niacini TaxID=86668 RepID=UPI002854B0D8|nr:hypothetical protein [Neobacillus niacini]MDR6999686.1 hypothetical protein [Neobacillus niacini]
MKKLVKGILAVVLFSSGIMVGGNYKVAASTTTPKLSQGNLYTDDYFTAYNKNHKKLSMIHNKVQLVKVDKIWYKTRLKYKVNKTSQILYVKKEDVVRQKTYEQAYKDLDIILKDMLKKATVKKVRVYLDYNQEYDDQWQYTFKNELGVKVDWFQLGWNLLDNKGNIIGKDYSYTADNVGVNKVFKNNVKLYLNTATGYKNIKLDASAPKFIAKDIKPVYVK